MVRGVGAQVIHAIGPAAQVRSSSAAKRAGVPLIWTQPGVARWGRLLDMRAALSSARAVVLHSKVGARAQRRMNLRRQRCRVVVPGVMLPERLREHRRADARSALGMPADALVAASVGPLGDAGFHDRFFKAGASLCHARRVARLLVAGTSGEPAQTQRRAASLGVGDLTTVSGPAALGPALDAADIVYFSGDDAPVVPVTLLEALAAGVAIVTEPTPLIREIVDPGITALEVPRDHEALAVALLSLADDPLRREAMAREAAHTARERHDAERMTGEVAALYRELVGA